MSISSHVSSLSHLRLASSFAAALLLASTASAQQTSVIEGTVNCSDNSGPLPDVTVVATSTAGSVSSVTDSNGYYSISVNSAQPTLYNLHLENLSSGLSYVTPSNGVYIVAVGLGEPGPFFRDFVLSGCEQHPAGTVGGLVWEDLNCDGFLDPDEPGMSDVEIELTDCDGVVLTNTWTGTNGYYQFTEVAAGDYVLRFVAPLAYGFSPADGDSTADPVTGATLCFQLQAGETNLTWDAGLCLLEAPGVRSQGYWKNHPDEWPVDEIDIGGQTYDKAEAIHLMQTPPKGDKWLNLFQQLVAAKLNILVGNEADCVQDAIIPSADWWLQTYPRPVRASSPPWKNNDPYPTGAYLHSMLDDYNNGNLCAPAAED